MNDAKKPVDNNCIIDPDFRKHIDDVIIAMDYEANARRMRIEAFAKKVSDSVSSGTAKVDFVKKIDNSDVPVGGLYYSCKKLIQTEEILIVGSVGSHYAKASYDTTTSEAFDTGFYTAIKLLRDGTIDINDLTVEENTDG